MGSVLILSAGTRNLVVRNFREALAGRGRVVAADMSPLAPALYEADAWRLVPAYTDPGYLDAVLEICREEGVSGVLSLVDPELSVLAAAQGRLEGQSVALVGSPLGACERALDKMEMYRWLRSRGLPCAESWGSPSELEAALESGAARPPLFVKPARGSASADVRRAGGAEEALGLLSGDPGLMAQELLGGREAGVDAYVDLVSGEVVSLFSKWKLRMRAGETDKAESFWDDGLAELVGRLLLEGGYRGPVDVDVFLTPHGWVVSEVNPRFGGGYPFALACGCDHAALVAENLAGRANPKARPAYETGVQMAKYSEISVRPR